MDRIGIDWGTELAVDELVGRSIVRVEDRGWMDGGDAADRIAVLEEVGGR
jgi:hypothetical protein